MTFFFLLTTYKKSPGMGLSLPTSLQGVLTPSQDAFFVA